MKPEEIVCTAVLPQDIARSREFIAHALSHLPGHAVKTLVALHQHLQRLLIGKCVELATERFLQGHGIAHQSYPQHELTLQSARLFFRIKNENVELKFAEVPAGAAAAEQIVQLHALVPVAQWRKHKRIARYLFAFFAGDLRIVINQAVSSLYGAEKMAKPEQIELKGKHGRIFLTACPSRAECEQHFRQMDAVRIATISHCENADIYMACRVAELTAFQRAVQWGGV